MSGGLVDAYVAVIEQLTARIETADGLVESLHRLGCAPNITSRRAQLYALALSEAEEDADHAVFLWRAARSQYIRLILQAEGQSEVQAAELCRISRSIE